MIAARFLTVYFLTAVIDYAVFIVVFRATGGILYSQLAGRLFSVPFNYLAVRSKVFASDARHEVAGPKFALLYTVGFFVAWGLIEWLQTVLPFARPDVRVVVAKMMAEGGILIGKFFVQKHLIFVAKPGGSETRPTDR